jgi:hypothetical protein
MKRHSLEQIDYRNRAAQCARRLDLPGIRRKDVLSYWRAINRQYAFGYRRWASPRFAAARRAASEVEL